MSLEMDKYAVAVLHQGDFAAPQSFLEGKELKEMCEDENRRKECETSSVGERKSIGSGVRLGFSLRVLTLPFPRRVTSSKLLPRSELPFLSHPSQDPPKFHHVMISA